MPRARRNAAAAKSAEPMEPVEPEEQVNLDEHVELVEPEEQVNLDEPEELMEEEVEYEEVEEEVEEEEEEVVEEEEEDIEEEVEYEEVEEEVEEEEEEVEEEEEEVVEEEDIEEEVEYEEVEEEVEVEEDEEEVVEEVEDIEEEVEYEEVEEEVEEEEEEVVEEEEDIEEEEEDNTRADEDATAGGDDSMKVDEEDERDEDEIKEHAELLALPPHGSEVYIGGLPHDLTEEDLKSFCESVGEVHEVRMIKGKDSSENRGYAFVTFRTNEVAAKAMKDLNDTEFKGKIVKCSTSQAKNRLFIGDIPRNWMQDDLEKRVTKVGPGVVTVDLMKGKQFKCYTSQAKNGLRRRVTKGSKKLKPNRGFAFVEYYNHACAEYSRKKMSDPKFKLDNNTPAVFWADPKSGDSSPNYQMKAVYVKNLPMDVTEDQLRKLFEHHGEITRVVLPPAKSGQEKRYGFVNFLHRSAAQKALRDTEKYELNGDVLKCSLAKSASEKKVETGSNSQKLNGDVLKCSLAKSASEKKVETGSNSQTGGLLSNFGAPWIWDFAQRSAAFGALAPGFSPPMIYGSGQTPGGMATVPMILPDGRIGYVSQQPGAPAAPQQRSDGQGGSSSSGGHSGNDINRGYRFQPY